MSDCLNRPCAEPVDTAECDCREGERCADTRCISRIGEPAWRSAAWKPAQERAPVYAAEWGGGGGCWGHPAN